MAWKRAESSTLAAIVLAGSMAAAQEPPDLLIAGGTVVTMDDELRVLEDGALVIDGSRIVSVLASGVPVPEAKERIDASGMLVVPGLVNTHGHVPMSLLRGLADDMKLMEWLNDFIFPAEARNVDEEFCYWGTLLSAIEMARSGTTTFTDMYYFEETIAKAVDEAGLRAVLGQTIIGFPAPDFETTEEALRATEAFVVKWKDHPRVVPSVAPHALYTTDIEVVVRARELSRRYQVPFQLHAHESPEEDEAVRAKYGETTATLLEERNLLGPGMILHHAITLSDPDIALLAERGAAVSHNPESNMKGASGLARVPDLLARGVVVGLGTDGPASNNNLDLFEEMDTAAKVHKLVRSDPTVMPAKEVFRMATRGGAKALGLDALVGSLEPGKRADVVLIDVQVPELTPMYDVYSHLVYAIKGAHVKTVVVDGRVVVRDRKMITLDETAVMEKARAIQARIRESLK
ncbi:MAG TPA: amidohydrolase [Vicinamibacteria bacterium]|nr:amidohydrolase [Vicinamibacteria bacterium]